MAEGQVNANKVTSGLTIDNQATDAHILYGYQAFSQNGVILTGIIPDLGNLGTRTLADGETYKIDKSYVEHVLFKAKPLTEQTIATALATDISYGKTAWVNGELVTGVMDTYIIDSGYDVSISAGNVYNVPAGYYNNAFTVTAKGLAEQTPGDAIAEDITVDKKAWVNGELVIGTMDMSSNTQATATADKLLIGETAWVNGELITGTIPICRTADEPEIIEVKPGGTYSITRGYYEDGSLVVSNETLPFLTGTAVASDVLEGKSIYIDNVLTNGTMKDYGNHIITNEGNLTIDAGLELVIDKPGYYHSIIINTTPLSEQTVGTATEGSILDGRTAWSNGELVTGTIPIIDGTNIDMGPGDVYTIPQGYHDGTGTVSAARLSDTTNATATSGDILDGKTAWVNGSLVTGTMPNKGDVNATVNCGGSYTIPSGYHTGGGTVQGASLASQTVADAIAGNILVNKTAWVNGTKITGTMPNKGAPTSALNCGGSYTIAAGYYSGGKVTANSLASQTAADAAAGHILTGKTAWVNGTKITGTMPNKGTVNIIDSRSGNSGTYTIPAGYYAGGTITHQKSKVLFNFGTFSNDWAGKTWNTCFYPVYKKDYTTGGLGIQNNYVKFNNFITCPIDIGEYNTIEFYLQNWASNQAQIVIAGGLLYAADLGSNIGIASDSTKDFYTLLDKCRTFNIGNISIHENNSDALTTVNGYYIMKADVQNLRGLSDKVCIICSIYSTSSGYNPRNTSSRAYSPTRIFKNLESNKTANPGMTNLAYLLEGIGYICRVQLTTDYRW